MGSKSLAKGCRPWYTGEESESGRELPQIRSDKENESGRGLPHSKEREQKSRVCCNKGLTPCGGPPTDLHSVQFQRLEGGEAVAFFLAVAASAVSALQRVDEDGIIAKHRDAHGASAQRFAGSVRSGGQFEFCEACGSRSQERLLRGPTERNTSRTLPVCNGESDG
jgi:hypothetical protein